MVKRILLHWLRTLANWIYHQPRLKQLALALVEKLPPAVEDRLRSGISRGNRTALSSQANVVVDPLSASEKRILRDMTNRRAQARFSDDGGNGKRRLAYFSPLPPEKSGISHYSLMLIPQLARHFQVDVVVKQAAVDSLPEIDDCCTILDFEQFCARADHYDRILYHIGNSHFHSHMFEALEKWPGVVVLHDFFLGHVIRHMDMFAPGYLAENLYHGWGLTAAAALRDPTRSEELIWTCPLNAAVMENAIGIIAHSPFSQDLARQHYGKACRQHWHVIPHLREPALAVDKAEVRATLGIPPDAFLVCSFGHITPTKLHHIILNAWQASRLGKQPNCWLVFVGENAGGAHGRLINQLIKQARNPRIKVTGWADSTTFEQYLSAADVAVQLRSRSRGETSGAVIDCMNHGLATVINAHGTMADLPDDSVCKLPDDVAESDIVDVLETLLFDQAYRQRIGECARNTILTHHDPASCGTRYAHAIEDLYLQQQTYYEQLDTTLATLGDQDIPHNCTDDVLHNLSNAAPFNLKPRQLLVDVSAIVKTDLKTGIERVVRAQLLGLIDHPPAGYRIEPVYLNHTRGHWQYQYGRSYGFHLAGVPAPAPSDDKVEFRDGDILYMPDLNAHSIIRARQTGLFEAIRQQGVDIHCLIHDILPVTHPEFFPSAASAIHQDWLDSITEFAHQIICISRAVADQYGRWLNDNGQHRSRLPRIAVNHHGADIDASSPTSGYPRHGRSILKKLSSGITFVMVGTIEPRKGHLDALAAFDTLWQAGEQVNLIIIGKEGWKDLPAKERKTIPDTIKKLDWHPQRNKRLFWLSDISDEYLDAVYRHSHCLLAASYDEGFGLPLIEAARHELAIVARDIPVFREVAGPFARYFGDQNLAPVLQQWIVDYRQGQAISTRTMPLRSWADNISDLKALLTRQRDAPSSDAPESQANGLY
jgi:glycosyltransferase involved in cell wall biosynthesis